MGKVTIETNLKHRSILIASRILTKKQDATTPSYQSFKLDLGNTLCFEKNVRASRNGRGQFFKSKIDTAFRKAAAVRDGNVYVHEPDQRS